MYVVSIREVFMKRPSGNVRIISFINMGKLLCRLTLSRGYAEVQCFLEHTHPKTKGAALRGTG